MKLTLCLLLALAVVVLAKRPTSTTKSPGKPAKGSQAQWSGKNQAQWSNKASTKPAKKTGKAYVLEKPAKAVYAKEVKVAKEAKPVKEFKITKEAKITKDIKPIKEIKITKDVKPEENQETEQEAYEMAEEEDEPTLVLLESPEEEKTESPEDLLPTALAKELATLRAELAAERELERLRSAVQSRKERAARKALKPKAKKCMDVDFTGAEGDEVHPAMPLQRCSCSCRVIGNGTEVAEVVTNEELLAQAVGENAELAMGQSLDEI